MNIRFIPLEETHMDLILSWLKTPHVKKFWSESEIESEVRAKYLGKKAKNIHGFMVELNGRIIGYIQHYEAWNVGAGWWPDAKPGTYGLDQMIGEEKLLNQGIGTEMVRKFIHELLMGSRGVKEVIADPDPANIGAIRSYEKVGFKQVGMVPTPYGESLLMTYRPSGDKGR